ncbi:DUF2785 domain-containing protein [Planotetraspora kaengkrachanensis]|uniref:DUF2785 domain-containing protein n=1 Tax=Planotetraspora kaengkrachanensis TaxID=575193 RepID=A0A8J3PW39_9ACTN|nr:DUF2785 domain-containing protein [Planotetraspora kaengkrachanensis]GIG82155.1 hypothetical protein Pka01_52820 [Planotetraspora kaengkrachanensis]
MPSASVDWPSVAAVGFPFPRDVAVRRLADELSAMLVSPDPTVRDDHAYTALARWTGEGHLDELLVDIGDTSARRFTHPDIQARSFAALVLARVLDRVRAVPRAVPEETADRWYGTFAAWFPAEVDTRGWDNTLGWLHAVAHGADAAAAFATVLPCRGSALLDLCARRMIAEATRHCYVQLEDARLARAITAILFAPCLSVDEATGWLDTVTRAFAGAEPGPVPPWAFNTFATLQSLHLHLARGLTGRGTPPHAKAVTAHVEAILRGPFPWLL